MVLAHMRGLLEPDYPHGVKSWIREKMVLDALEREVQGQGFLTKAMANNAALPVIKPEARQRHVSETMEFIAQGIALLQCAPYAEILKMKTTSEQWANLQRVATLFKVLKKTDFYEKMHKTLAASIGRR